MMSDTVTKWEGAHPTIGLFVFAVACAMTVGEVSAQVATFTTQQYPLLGNTHIAADLNADGKPDLAGAGRNAVSVMLGNGDGTFRARTDFPLGAQTQAVAAGDFNSDGKVDLVITLNSPQFSLALLTGTGTGSFNAPTFFPNTSGFDSPAIAATDLNRDGKLDLVVMHTIACFTAPCRAARSITILLGNGNGTFQTPREIDVGTGPMAMAVGDFNDNGIKDVAIGGGNTELSILLGVGDGTFVLQPVVTLVPGGDLFSACNDIAVGDLNRDSIQDLVVPLGNGEGNAILIGNGNGTFQVRSRIQIDETFAPLHVAVADYNRDGLLDIARTMGDGTNGLMQILRGNGDGAFQAPNRYLVPPPNSSVGGIVIIAGDWNVDAKPDVAFVVGGASAALDVLINTTGGVPPSLGVASLSLNPTTVTGGNSSTGTVTLTAVAQASTTVAITSNAAAAIVPSSVIVPAGSSSRTFTIGTTQVPATTSAIITASLNNMSRSATLTINPTGTDTISITRAEYESGNRRLRVEATSTRATATLQVFVTSSGQLIGTLSNEGSGRFRGELTWPANPQSITVRSNFGGQATRTVTLR
jgi:FG-GAP-like repeat